MATSESTRVVNAALFGNLLVASTKVAAALVTGSSAMMSEAVHSAVDTGNELLLLYGLVGYGGLRAARRARGAYAALLAAGITALILSQALLNVFAVLGLAPLTGVPLPFISSGSSSLLVLLAGMGLLLNVAGGGQAHLEAVSQGSPRGAADPDRGRRDGGARRARARGRRRAAS